MTQAYNLAIMANAVDSSGKLNVGTNSTGVLPVANGGTGSSSPSLVAGSGISISGSFPNQTITNSSTATGTVTSVATGNGLSGGTITTTGTLVIACPSANSVGSYAFVNTNGNGCPCGGTTAKNFGSNYSAGTGTNQISTAYMVSQGAGGMANGLPAAGGLSGTWKWLSASTSYYSYSYGIACRVS